MWCVARLVPFIQVKKRGKHPWKSVNFTTKINTPPWCFSRFLNCAIGTKSCNAPHMENYSIEMVVSVHHYCFDSTIN